MLLIYNQPQDSLPAHVPVETTHSSGQILRQPRCWQYGVSYFAPRDTVVKELFDTIFEAI